MHLISVFNQICERIDDYNTRILYILKLDIRCYNIFLLNKTEHTHTQMVLFSIGYYTRRFARCYEFTTNHIDEYWQTFNEKRKTN